MVVAQLVAQSLPIPEVRSSKPEIGKMCIEHLFTVLKRRKIKKKAGNGPIFKKTNHRILRLESYLKYIYRISPSIPGNPGNEFFRGKSGGYM